MENNILNIPSMGIFNNDWNLLLKFMENEGNPPFSFDGDLDLSRMWGIRSLAGLVSVGGSLDVARTNIKSFGNLKYVGGDLLMNNSSFESLGVLEYVGGNLEVSNTFHLKMTKEEIRNQVNVGGNIYGRQTDSPTFNMNI